MRILEILHDEDHPQYTNLDRWVAENDGFTTRKVEAFKDFEAPSIDEYDLFIVHGGSQHLYDKQSDPWLIREMQYLSEALRCGKAVIGFCLGSQILAEILGAKVFEMADKEIGWFPVRIKEEFLSHDLVRNIAPVFDTFLWHSDHYELPSNCLSIASTEAAEHQIFVSNKYPAVAFQFHPEYTKEIIYFYFETCYDEYWTGGRYVARKQGFLEDLKVRDDTYHLFSTLMNNTMVHLHTKYNLSLKREAAL